MHKIKSELAPALMLILSLSAAAFAQNADAKAKADEILKKARAAIGDESKLKAVQGLSASGTARQSFGERQMESELEIEMMMPDKIRKTTNSQFATITNALNGEQLWNDFVPGVGMGGGGGNVVMRGGGGGPGGPGGANSPMGAYFQQQQKRELMQIMLGWFLMSPPSSQMQFAFVGEAQGPNGKVDVLDGKSADGIAARLYIDQATHRLVGLSFKAKQMRRGFGGRGQGGGPGGPPGGGGRPPQGQPQAGGQPGQGQPSDEERERRRKEAMEAFEKSPDVDYRWAFDDYKSVGGLNLPHRLTKSEGGTPNEEWEISKFKINPKLSADKFVKKEKEKTQ